MLVMFDVVEYLGAVLGRILKDVVIVHPTKKVYLAHRGFHLVSGLFGLGHGRQENGNGGLAFERIEVFPRVRLDLALVARMKMKQGSSTFRFGYVIRDVVSSTVTARKPFDAPKRNGRVNERLNHPFAHVWIVADSRAQLGENELGFGHGPLPT